MSFSKIKGFDFFLFLFHLVIFSLGLFAILSTSFSAFKSQLVFFVVGLFLYFLFCFFDLAVFRSTTFVFVAYIVSILSLIGLFAFGENIRNAARWYNLYAFNFQPSEIAKIVEIIVLAKLFGQLSRRYLSVKMLFLSFIIILPFILLIAKQPDLGSALVVLGIWVFTVLYVGVNPKHILVFLLAISLFSYPVWNVLRDYQQQRVISFINPYADPKGSGYNVIQSIVSVGSGGYFGRGFGRGTQSHLRFLPEYKTDFIFAAFSEEWGFLGSAILVTLYFGLLFKILSISRGARNGFFAIFAFGAFSLLFIQCFVNVGMNLGILPVTGITLPLVSYGGSSLIAVSILLGAVQGIAIRRRLW